MKVLVALNHPAHYYVFKFTVLNLKNLGYDVIYVIREKDILEKLLISEKVDFIKINEKRQRKSTVFSVVSNGIIELFKQDFNLLKLVVKWKPDLMIGTDIAITHVGSLLHIPSFVFNEDDFEINQLFCKTSYPFASKIIRKSAQLENTATKKCPTMVFKRWLISILLILGRILN